MTSQLTPEQIAELRKVAEKATPGRIGDRIDGSGSIKYQCVGYDGSLVLQIDHKNMEFGFIGDNAHADEEFFRACVPDVILSLLDALEARGKRIADQDREIDSLATVAGSNAAQVKELISRAESAEQALLLERQKEVSVKLPTPGCTYADHSYPAYSRAQVVELLASAGISLQKGDE